MASEKPGRATLYGLPCWWDGKTLTGRNRLADRLIPVACWIHDHFFAPFGIDGYPIRLEDSDGE